MRLSDRFRRDCTWINLPAALLVALLQRTPVVRVVATAADAVLASPLGVVLKSAVATAASLGAVHSLAGATQFQYSPSSSVSGKVGEVFKGVAFTITGSPTPPNSFSISRLPDGLKTQDGTNEGMIFAGTVVITGTPTTAGVFSVSVSGTDGTFSMGGSLSFNIAAAAATAPTVTTQPQSQTVTAGQSATFTVVASGTAPLSYQWRKDGADVAGATNATLTVTNAQAANAGSYTVLITNSAGSVASSAAVLTVNTPAPPPTGGTAPVFSLQPQSQTIATGSTVVFASAATAGSTYQWRRNGVNLPGATAATLVVGSAAAASAGAYTCVATNSTGSAISAAATLAVSTTTDTGRLVNLSIRTFAGTNDQTLFVGMAVGGPSGSQPVFIRVTGPALAAFGVPGTLADPVLTLLRDGTTVGANDNWGGSTQLMDVGASVGAFPLTDRNSKDAVLYNSALASGTYSVKVTGADGGTGVVLAELYDATASGTFRSTSSPRLINASARTQVDTGDNVLIAGFAVGGSTSKTVLIRAIGPTLTGFGVNGALADPKLELSQGGTIIAANDDWGGDAQLTSVGSGVGAFPLPVATSKDAILLVTLPPGTYAAKVFGANNGTGVALVELYDIP